MKPELTTRELESTPGGRQPRRRGVVVAVALLTAAMSVFPAGLSAAQDGTGAQKHALLIGIGDYPELYKLAGPKNDVEALSGELVGRWGFPRSNVTTLLDSQATRPGILAALDRLFAHSRPGDDVFVYYSGHGTSAFDEEFDAPAASRLNRWTGALMPYDYAAGLPDRPSAERWMEGLIIGRRDLLPRLARLDRDRSVFVIFDTCFAGYTVRSITKRQVRWVSPPPFRAIRSIGFADDPFEGPVFGTATAGRPSYPYKSLIYLAAAGKKERAEEVPARYSVDRRPHGALTNALLKALRGGADTNRDDRLTYFEVFEYVRSDVSQHHQQMPQLLFPEDRPGLVHRPVFGGGKAPAIAADPVPTPPAGELRLQLSRSLEHLRRRVAALSGVRLVDGGDHHVRLEREGDGLVAIYHPSGDRIAGGFDERRPQSLLERIARQVQVQALIDLQYPRQDFYLSLELPRGRGFLYRGEQFEITARSDRPAVFLLLNIDKAGTVSVLYPMNARELTASAAVRGDFEVVPPYGTEVLKLFAFSHSPERLTYWMNQKIDVLDPRFGEFLELLEAPGVSRAQTRLKLVTAGTLVSGAPAGR